MVKVFVVASVLAFLVGCSSRYYIVPPPEREVEKFRIYNKPFDVVWARAVEWFAEHNMTIDKIEKSSGLLTAKYPFEVTNRGFLEYGAISPQVPRTAVQYSGIVNLTVRQEEGGATRVRVNFFGQCNLEAQAKSGKLKYQWKEAAAHSTGKFEKAILEFIEGN